LKLYYNATLFDGVNIKENYSVAISNGIIIQVAPSEEIDFYNYSDIFDCESKLLCPAFIDSHMHLRAYSNSLTSNKIKVESWHKKIDLISQIEKIIANEPDYWIIINGIPYFTNKDFNLDRYDIDNLSPDRPVKIQFASMHGSLLNSKAMELLNISELTMEPTGTTFDRNLKSGNLSGIILEGESFINKLIPVSLKNNYDDSIKLSSIELEKMGVKTICDASFNNDIEKYESFSRYAEKGILRQRVVFMPGFDFIHEFHENGMIYGQIENNIIISNVKIMTSLSSGMLQPSTFDLAQMVNYCHSIGYPVAIHAVELECIKLAIRILQKDFLLGDRIEHASELDESSIIDIANSGINISTHPTFIYEKGDVYSRNIQKDNDSINQLYKIGSLIDKKIKVGISSDAPVSNPNPYIALYALQSRKTLSGEIINKSESVDLLQSLQMITSINAEICGQNNIGYIRKGYKAELILINTNLTDTTSEDWLNMPLPINIG